MLKCQKSTSTGSKVINSYLTVILAQSFESLKIQNPVGSLGKDGSVGDHGTLWHCSSGGLSLWVSQSWCTSMLCLLVNYHFKEKPTKAHKGIFHLVREKLSSQNILHRTNHDLFKFGPGSTSTFKDQSIMLVTLLQRPLANHSLARSLYSALQKLPFEPIRKVVFLCDITSARCVCLNFLILYKSKVVLRLRAFPNESSVFLLNKDIVLPPLCLALVLRKISPHCLDAIWALHIYHIAIASIRKTGSHYVNPDGPRRAESASWSTSVALKKK